MEILFEDRDIIVAVKPQNTVSENTPEGTGFADLLAAHTGTYIGVIHRLDRGVGGITVYAKTPVAAAELSRAVQERTLQKEYRAIVSGLPPAEGELCDLLYHDRRLNKTFVVDRERRGVKKALLTYQTLRTWEGYSLLHIKLLTGRTHQIRVQFASRGYPLRGDRKYGAKTSGEIGLCCYRLKFFHPTTKKTMEFTYPYKDFE